MQKLLPYLAHTFTGSLTIIDPLIGLCLKILSKERGRNRSPHFMGRYQKSTTKLTNSKAPVINGVLPNAFNALDDKNLSRILIFYNQFWRRQADFGKWHESQVVPVPPKQVSPTTPTSGEGLPYWIPETRSTAS